MSKTITMISDAIDNKLQLAIMRFWASDYCCNSTHDDEEESKN